MPFANRWQVAASLLVDRETNPPDAYPPEGFTPSGTWEPFDSYSEIGDIIIYKDDYKNKDSYTTEKITYHYVLWRRPLRTIPEYNPNLMDEKE
jgi:hypothetical protein